MRNALSVDRVKLNPKAKKAVADMCKLFNEPFSGKRQRKIEAIIKSLGFDPNAKVKLDKKTGQLSITMAA